MSDETAGEGQPRSLADRFLDLFVFAPAGALLNAAEDWPAMAEKGRSRIDQELRNAHVIGKYAVDVGRRQLQTHLDTFFGGGFPPARADHPAGGPPGSGDAGGSAAGSGGAGSGGAGSGGAARGGGAGGGLRGGGVPAAAHDPSGAASADAAPASARHLAPVAPDPVVDRAIPGYDSLSASQVVRRLDGLSPEELEAVERHERDGRGRRTILSRARQLLDERAPSDPSG